jgi:hypothetical protein
MHLRVQPMLLCNTKAAPSYWCRGEPWPSRGFSRAPASRSLVFPDELPTFALEQADGFSVPRIQQCLDEVWSSTTVGAPAILFLRSSRRRSFAAIGVVHGSPSANAAQYAGYLQGGQCFKLSSEQLFQRMSWNTRGAEKGHILAPSRASASAGKSQWNL